MAKNLEQVPAQFRQVYFTLPVAVSDSLKVKSAQDRKTMRDVLTKLVEGYVNGKFKI